MFYDWDHQFFVSLCKATIMDEVYHVYPIDDIRDHELTEFCECNPVYKDGVWSHNSFDGREFIEALTDDRNIHLN